MTRPWQYAENQFLNSTKRNYRRTNILSLAHYAFLTQKTIDFPLDPDWETLRARYKPLHLAWVAAYAGWIASGGSLKGNTLSLKQLFKLIPAKLDVWMGIIIPFYPKGTPRYVSMFPQDRNPFTKGKTDSKITAVNTLSIAIGTDADLAPAKTLVDDAYVELDTARSNQSGSKTTKTTDSETVETCRKDAMNMQYRNAGFLIDKYYETPVKIESVFDLLNLRNKLQSVFNRKMKVTEVSPLVEHTFEATNIMRIKVKLNHTPTDSVSIYLGTTLGGIDSTAVNVVNNHEAKIDMTEFHITDYSTHRFLTAVTAGNTAVVELMVELY